MHVCGCDRRYHLHSIQNWTQSGHLLLWADEYMTCPWCCEWVDLHELTKRCTWVGVAVHNICQLPQHWSMCVITVLGQHPHAFLIGIVICDHVRGRCPKFRLHSIIQLPMEFNHMIVVGSIVLNGKHNKCWIRCRLWRWGVADWLVVQQVVLIKYIQIWLAIDDVWTTTARKQQCCWCKSCTGKMRQIDGGTIVTDRCIQIDGGRCSQIAHRLDVSADVV